MPDLIIINEVCYLESSIHSQEDTNPCSSQNPSHFWLVLWQVLFCHQWSKSWAAIFISIMPWQSRMEAAALGRVSRASGVVLSPSFGTKPVWPLYTRKSQAPRCDIFQVTVLISTSQLVILNMFPKQCSVFEVGSVLNWEQRIDLQVASRDCRAGSHAVLT